MRPVVAGLLILLSGCYFNATLGGADAESKAYLDGPVRHIFTSWSVSDLDRQVVPDFYKDSSRKDLVKLLSACKRKLGPLRRYTIDSSSREASVGTQSYDVTHFFLNAHFAKADGKLYVELMKQGAVWKLQAFRINSNALLE